MERDQQAIAALAAAPDTRTPPPPRLLVSRTEVTRGEAFSVCVVVSKRWMDENKVDSDQVWAAGHTSVVHREGREDQQPLPPCPKCKPGGRSAVAVRASVAQRRAPVLGGQDALEYVFDRCLSSSRLHLGGRVVIVMELRSCVDKSVVCRLTSSPLTLRSRFSHRRSPASAAAAPAQAPAPMPPVAAPSSASSFSESPASPEMASPVYPVSPRSDPGMLLRLLSLRQEQARTALLIEALIWCHCHMM
eukprot:m51a1_g3516 hypothetical protein (247) ;mRNA; f:906758-907783